MADYDLDRLLVQIRRIEEHREKGAEAEIRKTYQVLLQDLRHFLADEYTRYAEDDQLTYEILQRHGAYARFLEEVEQKINDISPEIRRSIRSTVEQTYEYTYNGMVESVKKVVMNPAIAAGLKACTPDVIRRAVENPVSKLTLNDRLEKHRKEIVYDIKQNITVGLMNGDRYTTMANRIKQSVDGDYKKAIRIARTETHRVREAGNIDAAMSVDKELKIGESGTRMVKTWRTMKDERVRPAKVKGKNRKYDHRKMDGVAILVDEEFTLPSGAKTMAPGQSGVAGEDINCRCYLSYGLQKVDLRVGVDNDTIKVQEESLDSTVQNFLGGIDTDREKLGKKVLEAYHVEGVPVHVKAMTDYGYCSVKVENDILKVIDYNLNANDKRSAAYQVKTAFHEAYHASGNGHATDFGKIANSRWLDIEETFAESTAHYAAGTYGIIDLAPSYPDKLVKMLPRLKQLPEFSECNKIADFGKVAQELRQNGGGSTWKQLSQKTMRKKFDFGDYTQQYFPEIRSDIAGYVDKILENMPECASYRNNMITDLEKGMANVEKLGFSLNDNESIMLNNAVAVAMNRIGVK